MTNSSVGFPQFYQIQQILDRFLDDIQRKPIRQQNQHPYLITTHAIHPQNPYKKAGYCTGFVVN
ncbi:hypothetical protein EFP44_06145 [Lacticaseibacillus paracasei]|nr:hypothetical protein [Lacticaseibacillus paracasei]